MSQDQRYLLDYYLNLYNQTIRQIDLMHLSLDSIRYNMDTISGLATPVRRRRHRPRPRQSQQSQQSPQQRQQQQNQSRNSTSAQPSSSSSSTNAYNTAYFEYYIPHSSDHDVTSLLNLFQSLGATTTATTVTTAATANTTPVMDPSANISNCVLGLMPTVTRTITYSDINNPLNTQCPIILNNFDPSSEVVQILGCGHIFTSAGITTWFRTNPRCPVCRYDVRLYGTLSDPRYRTNQPARSTFPHSNTLQ